MGLRRKGWDDDRCPIDGQDAAAMHLLSSAVV